MFYVNKKNTRAVTVTINGVEVPAEACNPPDEDGGIKIFLEIKSMKISRDGKRVRETDMLQRGFQVIPEIVYVEELDIP